MVEGARPHPQGRPRNGPTRGPACTRKDGASVPRRPASSAGVERMFSKAGKLYDDAKKGQNDDKLEAALFASANTE